jgi:hypothetical protein
MKAGWTLGWVAAVDSQGQTVMSGTFISHTWTQSRSSANSQARLRERRLVPCGDMCGCTYATLRIY